MHLSCTPWPNMDLPLLIHPYLRSPTLIRYRKAAKGARRKSRNPRNEYHRKLCSALIMSVPKVILITYVESKSPVIQPKLAEATEVFILPLPDSPQVRLQGCLHLRASSVMMILLVIHLPASGFSVQFFDPRKRLIRTMDHDLGREPYHKTTSRRTRSTDRRSFPALCVPASMGVISDSHDSQESAYRGLSRPKSSASARLLRY
jgi:hypothetical protein